MGGILTSLAVSRATANVNSLAQDQFDQNTRDVRDAVISRLTQPRYGLGGLRSTIAALGKIPTASEFRNAILARNLPSEFPGVLGFGLIVPVSQSELSAFSAQANSEYGGTFMVHTNGTPAELLLIRSIEPLRVNHAALGFDVGSESIRRSAVEAARRNGSLAITAPIHLLQMGGGTWGLLYLLPVYTTDSAGQRSFIGLVCAVASYEAMMTDLDRASTSVSFSLTDKGTAIATPVFTSQRGVFSSLTANPHFRDVASFGLGGRQFSLTMVSTPAFDGAASYLWPFLLALLGSVISMLLALATWLLVAGKRRAIVLTGQITHDLDRLSMVAKLTLDAVLVTDNKANVIWANPAFYRASRRPPKEVLLHRVAPFLGKVVDDAPGQQKSWGLALEGKGSFHGMASRALPDGTAVWLETEIQPMRDRRDRPDGLVIIQSNVTARRVAELQLKESQSFLDRTGRAAGMGGWQIDLATQAVLWSAHTRRIHEVPDDFVPSMSSALEFYPGAARKTIEAAVQRSIDTGKGWDLELPFTTYRDRHIWVRAMGVVELEGSTPVRLTGAFQDITQRKRLELDLQENRELLRVTLSSIGDAVITTGATGVVTWMNAVAEQLSGWRAEEAKGHPITDVLSLVSEETRHSVTNPIMAALAEKKVVGVAHNTVLLKRDGTECGVSDSAAPIFDAAGTLLGAVMVFHDVTEIRAINREIAHHARHDPLTGLPNRIEFEARAAKYLNYAEYHGGSCVVLFIDLDHFKIVNDTCGHSAGDEVLRQVSGIIQASIRSFDTVARLGGDEFAILLENCNLQGAEKVAQEICDAMDLYRFVAANGQHFRVGTSIGLAALDVVGRSLESTLQAADSACYIAKTTGRNQYHVWTPYDGDIQTQTCDIAWGVEIERALDGRSFVLHAQLIEPRSHRARARVTGLCCEILVRMNLSNGKAVSPSTFMQAAERYQLASQIDRWVVQAVFDQLGDNQAAVGPNGQVSVNLSGQSIGDFAFHQFIKEVVERAQFDVRAICFEIKETAAITNLAAAVAFVSDMKKLGIRTALDDFGMGVTSFGYLKKLNVDFLKLDGEFVSGIASNPIDLVSVKSFCEVATVLGIETIAEHVEDDKTLRLLDSLSVDFAQGFFIHRPEPFIAVLESLVTS